MDDLTTPSARRRAHGSMTRRRLNTYLIQPDGSIGIVPSNADQPHIIDFDMYDVVRDALWCERGGGYLITTSFGFTIALQHVVMDLPAGVLIDHIDTNPRNNRRSNLRVITRAQNVHNQGRRSDNTSGVKGVSWNASKQRWVAYVTGVVDGKRRFLHNSTHQSLEEAAVAVRVARERLHGDYANHGEVDISLR